MIYSVKYNKPFITILGSLLVCGLQLNWKLAVLVSPVP